MSRRPEGSDLAQELAGVLGHRFGQPDLLREALTHPSAVAAGRAAGPAREARRRDYERLEFLGDRVLGLVIADLLYRVFPAEVEGALARRLAVLAREDTLARVAAAAGLGAHLMLSRGEAGSGGRDNPTLLADACEAVIGALYLDGGLPAAARFIERYWRPLVAEDAQPPQDAKTALQEWAQGAGLPLPVYRILHTEGPAHEPRFVIEVTVRDRSPATATGRSKRAAEQAAAAALLEQLRAARND